MKETAEYQIRASGEAESISKQIEDGGADSWKLAVYRKYCWNIVDNTDEHGYTKLPSESPKGFDEPWEIRLEKIVVDVFTDKLVSRIVPDGEKGAIISGAFDSYLLDEKTMIRYARR